jgi:hypothetical protein
MSVKSKLFCTIRCDYGGKAGENLKRCACFTHPITAVQSPGFWGLRGEPSPDIIDSMQAFHNPNAKLPACWIHFLVCPRRHLAVLPSQARPNLFGSD